MSEDFTRRVTAEVRAEAGRQGLNQGELAAKAGMSPATLNRRWNDQLPFDTDDLARIARALDVPVMKILAAAAGEAAGNPGPSGPPGGSPPSHPQPRTPAQPPRPTTPQPRPSRAEEARVG